MANAPVKSTRAVIADNSRKPSPTQSPIKKTNPIPALNQPPVNEFAKFQQNSQTAGPAGRPPSPAIRPGTISSVLFSRPEPVQKMVLPDSVALDRRSLELHPEVKGTPTREEMHEALLVLKGVFGPSEKVSARKKRAGLGNEEMSLSKAQAIVKSGLEEHLGLGKWETRLNEEQVTIGLAITSPDGPPTEIADIETLKMAIREAGKPTSSAPVAPIVVTGGGSLPSTPTSDPVTQAIDALFEKPEEPPEGTFSKIMRFVRRFMGWEDQLGFAGNRFGPRSILDTLYQSSRFGGFGQGGGFGSQIGNVLGRFGIGGFGGGGAAAAGTAGAGATAGGAAAATGAAGSGAAGGSMTIGGVVITAKAALIALVVAVVVIVFFGAIASLKQQDMAEIIPIQGTGGLDGGGGGSFGPSYIFDGVCWPIAGPGVQVSDTPEGHADRNLSDGGSAIDIRAIEGTPVQSSVDGTIIYSGRHGAARPSGWVPYGGLVVIKIDPAQVNNQRVLVFYAHLSRVAIEVPLEGDEAKRPQVRAGDYIGDVGNTGNSHGSHLHMESINMDIRSILPTWQEIKLNTPIPVRCEGGSETIL